MQSTYPFFCDGEAHNNGSFRLLLLISTTHKNGQIEAFMHEGVVHLNDNAYQGPRNNERCLHIGY